MAKTMQLLTARCGKIRPDSVADYLASGGFSALKKAMDMAWRHNIHKLIGDIDVHNFAIRENLLRTGFLLDCGQSIFLLEKQI